MAVKIFELDGIGEVRVSKRQGTRNLRLSISPAGQVRVSIPPSVPYQKGLAFARARADWIREHTPPQEAPLQHGHRIGKAHRLVFDTATIDSPSTRLAGTEIRVLRPLGMATTHSSVQQAARRASLRALRAQAESLLPQRLATLARQHGFQYSSVGVRQLSGRWGSCDNQQQIVLNLFLMQLPWQLIDYVLLHELVHTHHLNHSDAFWTEFIRHEPQAKHLRRMIRTHKPILVPA